MQRQSPQQSLSPQSGLPLTQQQILRQLPASQPYGLFTEDLVMRPLEDRVTTSHKMLHIQPTTLSNTFFATANVDVIQLGLRDAVQRATRYTIDRQSDEQLVIVMRYIYIEHASHKEQNVDIEVRRLNDLVVREALPNVISNLAQYLAYLRDASKLPEPLPRGQQTSVRGTKTASLFRPL